MNGDRSELKPHRRGYLLPLRPGRGRMVAGVCAGLAAQWTIDVRLVRLVFLLLGLAWGLGVLVYLALWVLMPDAEESAPITGLERTVRRNARHMGAELRMTGRRLESTWAHIRPTRPVGATIDRSSIALGVIILGVLLLLISIGAFAWVTPLRLFGLAVIVAGIGVLLTLGGRQR